MSDKLIAFPNRARIREQAALWASRVDRGLSEAERAELKTWLGVPAHRQAFLEFAALWDQMGALSELAELFPLEKRDPGVSAPAGGSRWLRAAAAAACVAVFAGWAGWYWPTSTHEGPTASAESAPSRTFETAIGERAVHKLEDGSTITLNTGTSLEVRLTSTSRELYLRRGEAHFAVAHDSTRPFNVHAGGRIVQAVGTAFNVRFRELSDIEVTVTEGKVKVWSVDRSEPSGRIGAPSPAGETLLMANESLLTSAGGTHRTRVAADDVDARLAWQRGMLVFRGDPLESVLAEVARYAPVDFVIQDESLRDVRVGGYFRAGDIEGLLFALEQNFRIDSKRNGDGHIVLSASDETG